MTPPAPFLLNNLSFTTWLLLGACTQSIFFFALPSRVACLPAAVLLLLRSTRTFFITAGYLRNPGMESVHPRKMTVLLQDPDEKKVPNKVRAILTPRDSKSPLGLMAPGFSKTGQHLHRMWADAESNPEVAGFIGRSTPFISPSAHSLAILTISYWRSLDDLHTFAQSPVHRAAWDWWAATKKQLPHIGLMHEAFESESGQWETLYEGFKKLGMGEIRRSLAGKEDSVPALIEASGRFGTMGGRLGREWHCVVSGRFDLLDLDTSAQWIDAYNDDAGLHRIIGPSTDTADSSQQSAVSSQQSAVNNQQSAVHPEPAVCQAQESYGKQEAINGVRGQFLG
ncbi:MAG: hypothetical protein Q9214_000740 [Letrouitia sp. 1 TL-2023]